MQKEKLNLPETALLEIGTEELPPRFFRQAADQLKLLADKKLTSFRLSFQDIRTRGTPRRLILEIAGLSERQPDLDKVIRGPAKQASYTGEGKPTPALLGFLKTHEANPESVFIQEAAGKPYVFVKKKEEGKDTKALLRQIFTELISEITFSKSMRWDGNFSFARPIRWILALFGVQVIPFEIGGVASGNSTYGHRFLSSGSFSISNPEQYETALKNVFVIPDNQIRKEMIKNQLETLAEEKGMLPYPSGSLLEEVALLVEYPTVFLGCFEERFLALPQQVLITVMEHHQRYFPLTNSRGELSSYFGAVRNGNQEGLDGVREGNEQVLKARFKDAEYFFLQDQKIPLLEQGKKLDQLVFQKNLGTVAQKVQRMQELAEGLVLENENLRSRISTKDLETVIRLCKCDLVTQMVFEFPELQGVMGKEYALREGYPEKVAQGIPDHYLPRFSGDVFPGTLEGSLVGILDRMDTLVGCFNADLRPTGSSDPLGLRRAGTALLQILLEKKLELNLEALIHLSSKEYHSTLPAIPETPPGELLRELEKFLYERNEGIWKSEEIRYDLIRAFRPLFLRKPVSSFQRAKFLEKFQIAEKEKFLSIITAWVRIFNIISSKEAQEIVRRFEETQPVLPEKWEEPEEKNLYKFFRQFSGKAGEFLSSGEPEKAWKIFSELEAPIHLFFEKILVMAPVEETRKNRLLLLWKLRDWMWQSFGDLAQIIFD